MNACEILFSQAAGRTDFQTFPAARAFGIIDAGKIVRDCNRSLLAVFFASFAARTSHEAVFTSYRTLVFIGTHNCYLRNIGQQFNDLLGTGLGA